MYAVNGKLSLLLNLCIFCLSSGSLMKRSTRKQPLYFFSNREGCVSVTSEAPCKVSWKLNTYMAKVYKAENEIIAAKIQQYKEAFNLNDKCVKALEEVLCSQAFPKCSTEDSSRDYGNVVQLCRNVDAFCPLSINNNQLQQEERFNRFCRSFKTGKHDQDHCVKPSKPVKGICPQPLLKMPSEALARYEKKSQSFEQQFELMKSDRYMNGERMFTNQCLTELKHIACSTVYCYANDTKLLIQYDRAYCYNVIKDCFDVMLTRMENSAKTMVVQNLRKQMSAQCDIFPDKSKIVSTDEVLAFYYNSSSHFYQDHLVLTLVLASILMMAFS